MGIVYGAICLLSLYLLIFSSQYYLAGEDYSMESITFTVLPSETEACLTIDILNDQIFEPPPPEEFFVLLSTSDPGVTIQGTSTATVTISDDDPPGN